MYPLTLRLAILTLVMAGGCATQSVVSYQNDIVPILNGKCLRCHKEPDGMGYVQSGLNVETYEALLQGTMFGTVIIPGDSKRSIINKLIEGRAGELMRMPHGDAKKLTAVEVEQIKLWVDQGALNN